MLSSVDQLLDELARGVEDVVANPPVMEGYRRDEAAPGLLEAELGPARALHRAVKRAFDPAGLVNPGKAI